MCLIHCDSTIPKNLKVKHFYLKADACEVVAVVSAAGVVFVIVVWSVAAKKKKAQKKTQQMLRKILAVLGWQNLSEVNESSGKERENPETGIGGE